MADILYVKVNNQWVGIPAIKGVGIASVTKSTSGLTDTYTMAYTDGTSYTFTVKNGGVIWREWS